MVIVSVLILGIKGEKFHFRSMLGEVNFDGIMLHLMFYVIYLNIHTFKKICVINI